MIAIKHLGGKRSRDQQTVVYLFDNCSTVDYTVPQGFPISTNKQKREIYQGERFYLNEG